MKKSYLLMLAIFCMSLCTFHCSRDSSPVGPELSVGNPYEGAVLAGNFVATGNNTVDFQMIQVSIKDTNVGAYPDVNGDFRLEGVPTGNQSLEVNVDNYISHIDVADIQSGEEIKMQLQIQENNAVMLQHMNRNKKNSEELQLEIRPKKWNIDWVNSVDEAHARLYGAGFDTITSVVIMGPTGTDIPVIRTEIGGVYYKAFFNQSDAIAAIPDPTRGDSHEITVTITYSEGTVDKPFEIEIVGQRPDEPEDELTLDIDPHKWNTNWMESGGYVTVRFRGEGFDTIVPGATEMSYNGGMPIEPSSDGIHGSSYMAKFTKKDAIGLFTEPKKGETYQVDVAVQLGSSTFTFPYTIGIVGPDK